MTMAWDKPAPELIARFDACRPPGGERRQMFGCPCVFMNGNLACGLHEQRLTLRLPEERRASLIAAGAAEPFAVMGRTMRDYVAVPDALRLPEEEFRTLCRAAADFTASLPAKAKQ